MKIRSISGSLLCEVFELFRCLSGAFLSLLTPSWEAFWSKKYAKNNTRRTLFFCYFGACVSISGRSLAPLEPILDPSGTRRSSKNPSKIGPKNDHKMDPKIHPKMTTFGPVLDPKMGSKTLSKIAPKMNQKSANGDPTQDGPNIVDLGRMYTPRQAQFAHMIARFNYPKPPR